MFKFELGNKRKDLYQKNQISIFKFYLRAISIYTRGTE